MRQQVHVCSASLMEPHCALLPSIHRHSGHRAAQLKHVVSDLRKVCNHPFLLPDFDPSNAANALAASAAAAAGEGAQQQQPMLASSPGLRGSEDQGAPLANGPSSGVLPGGSPSLGSAGAGSAPGMAGPGGSGKPTPAALLAQSGKMQVLARLLPVLLGKQLRVLLLAQSPKVSSCGHVNMRAH